MLRQINRRMFLQGAGGLLVGLPLLERFSGTAWGQSVPATAKRIIVMAYPMGIPNGAWMPVGTGNNFTLPFVTAPLEPFRDKLMFVTGVDNPMMSLGNVMHGHEVKQETALTGTLTTGLFPATNTNSYNEVQKLGPDAAGGAANGPSIEHVIGTAIRGSRPFSSVDLATKGETGTMNDTSSKFFFEGKGAAVTMKVDGRAVFDKLFVPIMSQIEGNGPSPADLALAQLRARNKSVLDAVCSSFKDVSQGLGKEDKRRLEEHAARIRQVELELIVNKESCSAPVRGSASYPNARAHSIDHINLLAHAMGCDLAPIGRIEYRFANLPYFGIDELDTFTHTNFSEGWHGLVHGDGGAYRPDGGGGHATDYNTNLLVGYRFFVEEFARLLSTLDSIQEGPDTTVLDNSLVVLASDFGEGLAHAAGKHAYVLAGNLGGAKRNYHYRACKALPSAPYAKGAIDSWTYAASNANICQVLNSIADMAGVKGSGGAPLEHGLQGYLGSVSKPRRIDDLFA